MEWIILIISYLLGSIPTALIYSYTHDRQDIRTLGDGNMGARNTKRQFGWTAGVIVAVIDILKGFLAVFVASAVGLPTILQLAAGIAVVLGHDFPLFAKFKGGQGFATTTGVILALFPLITGIGFIIYVSLFIILHNSDIAAGIGMAFIICTAWISHASQEVIFVLIGLLIFIPLKKWMDRSRIKKISPG